MAKLTISKTKCLVTAKINIRKHVDFQNRMLTSVIV